MKYLITLGIALPIFIATQNCSQKSPAGNASAEKSAPAPAIALPAGFNAYWFAGQAELCTYQVTQERYGALREAEQVNVFVTEDFSRSKQVKLDDANAAGADREPVLKLNTIRRFHTGIYDYSIMQSVFTPLNGTATLKSTTSVQDWCGHVFAQYNLQKEGYRLRSFSYFEKEGDQDRILPAAMLEEELWTRIRMASLQPGTLDIIPSATYARLKHQESRPEKATLTLEQGPQENKMNLTYTSIPRTLSIRFEAAFPYKILGWEERVDGQLASKGALKATRKSAYWTEHDNVHAPLRDSLQLKF